MKYVEDLEQEREGIRIEKEERFKSSHRGKIVYWQY